MGASFREWIAALWRYWYALVPGVLMDVVAVGQWLVEARTLRPAVIQWSLIMTPSGWLAVSLFMFLLASFLAFHDVRSERDEVKETRPNAAVSGRWDDGHREYVLTIENIGGGGATFSIELEVIEARKFPGIQPGERWPVEWRDQKTIHLMAGESQKIAIAKNTQKTARGSGSVFLHFRYGKGPMNSTKWSPNDYTVKPRIRLAVWVSSEPDLIGPNKKSEVV